MATYIGLDFGGTKLAAGVADANGRLLAQARCPTDAAAGPEGALAAMDAMTRAFGSLARDAVAVGISFGGPVDLNRTHSRLSHHGPGWEDFPLRERVGKVWERPVVMDNDANAAALGEARFGAGHGARNVLYVTVSTGIGGGVIIDGGLNRGSRGLSGEIGHTIVASNGPLCPCGKHGCLEAVASGPAIAAAYRAASGRFHESITAADVFAHAAAGDAAAIEVLDHAIMAFGLGLANAIDLLDPDRIVIGGGVSKAGAALFGPLRAAVRIHRAPASPDVIPIIPAALGDAVGILGAVALAASETPASAGRLGATTADDGEEDSVGHPGGL